LARLNACDKIATPLAQKELEILRQAGDGRVVHYTLYYHYARLIEALYAAERIGELLLDPDIMGSDLRQTSKVMNQEGVGVVEAPRGTLFHHYEVDERGAITKANMIVATGNNNWAINKPRARSTAWSTSSGVTTRAFRARPTPWARCRWRWSC